MLCPKVIKRRKQGGCSLPKQIRQPHTHVTVQASSGITHLIVAQPHYSSEYVIKSMCAVEPTIDQYVNAKMPGKINYDAADSD